LAPDCSPLVALPVRGALDQCDWPVARRLPDTWPPWPAFLSGRQPLSPEPPVPPAIPGFVPPARTARRGNSPAVTAVVSETLPILAATVPAPDCYSPVQLPTHCDVRQSRPSAARYLSDDWSPR